MTFPLLLTTPSTTIPIRTHPYVFLGTFLPKDNCCLCVYTCAC